MAGAFECARGDPWRAAVGAGLERTGQGAVCAILRRSAVSVLPAQLLLTRAAGPLHPHPQDVENIASLPVEAGEAEEMLKEDANLLQVVAGAAACAPRGLLESALLHLRLTTIGLAELACPRQVLLPAIFSLPTHSTLPHAQAYECLALLEGTSMKAQRALESGTHVNLKEAKNLNAYFQKARQALGSLG